MMGKVLVLQHHPAETLGAIADALESAALAWQYVRVYDEAPLPGTLKDAAGLILMGGPQTVYQLDRYPYFRSEMALINDALRTEKPILGVCLGSQLIAAALGARVYRNTSREIGWYPVRLSAAARDHRLMGGLPGEFMACHWHSDTFDLPSGAIALASSELTPLQAFSYGDRTLALQFHAEITEEILAALVAEFGEGLQRVGIDGAAIMEATPRHLPALSALGEMIFSRWARLIQGT